MLVSGGKAELRKKIKSKKLLDFAIFRTVSDNPRGWVVDWCHREDGAKAPAMATCRDWRPRTFMISDRQDDPTRAQYPLRHQYANFVRCGYEPDSERVGRDMLVRSLL